MNIEVDPTLVGTTEEDLEARIRDTHMPPDVARLERRLWEGTQRLYNQQECMIAALDRLAAALEKASA